MSESFELKIEDLSKKVEGEVQGDSVEKENKEVIDSDVNDSQLEELKEKDAIESSAKVDALLQEMSFQREKMTRGQFQQALENATTLNQVVEALEGFAVNGKIESNSASGAIDLQKAIEAIDGGYGQNVSDSSIQMAVRRIQEQGAISPETKAEQMTREQFQQALETAENLDQVIDAMNSYAVDGKIETGFGAGKIDSEKAKGAIREGYGRNISDGSIQSAVRRIEEEDFSEKGVEQMTREQFEQALENATTLEQVVDALEGFAEDGALKSDSPTGVLSLSKAVDAIRGGYGKNISDSHIQRAVRRIEG